MVVLSGIEALKKQLLNLMCSAMPEFFVRKFLPKNFVMYGHVISDSKHFIGDYYQYPTLNQFDKLIKRFQQYGYEFVSLTSYLQPEKEKKKILLSFDDGFKVIADELHPYMMKNRIPYAVFVLTQPLVDSAFQINSVKNTSGNRCFLNEDEIRMLKNDGVHIGFHSRTHLKIENEHLGSDLLNTELSVPENFSNLFSRPISFAYPYLAPSDFKSFNKLMRENWGYEYFFDTKGFSKPANDHFFRVSIDAEKDINANDWLMYVIKRQLILHLINNLKLK